MVVAAQRDLAVPVAFFAQAVLAGGNAVAVRFSNRELAPLWGAGLRFGVAAAVMLTVMAVLRLRFPRGRALLGTLLFALLSFAASYALIYDGLVHVQAGLGQSLLALVPLATLLLAVLWRLEQLRGVAVAAAIVAAVGVTVMSHGPLKQAVPLSSVLEILAAATCVAQAAVLVRWFPKVHPVTMNAVGMTIGAVMLLVASVAMGEPRAVPRRVETWWALGYASVIGSVVVFLLYLYVLQHWTASRVSYGFVLTPIVTVLLSALL